MKTTLITAFFLLSSHTFGQEMEKEPMDCAAFNLIGNVKAITEETFMETADPGGKAKLTPRNMNSWEHDYRLTFDEKGNLLKRAAVNITSTNGNETHTYENGRLKESATFSEITSYFYDEKGRISETVIKKRLPFSTDEGEQTVEKMRIAWVYDNQNRVVKRIHYNVEDKSSEVQNLRYENGLLVYEEMVEEDYSYKDWFDYKYDPAGNLIQMTWSDTDGLLERSTYTYTNGKRTGEKWEIFEEGLPAGYVEYTYVDGNPVKMTEVDDEGIITRTFVNTYTFDKQGNWISCRSVNGKVVYVVKRTLEYY